MILVDISPGQSFPCSSVFYNYYSVFDDSRRLIKKLYIVQKFDYPKILKYFVCPEADAPQEKHIKAEFQIIPESWFADLPDGTLLFLSSDTNDRFIIRLDQNLQQHTSMGGRMFALDAVKSNDVLESEQNKSENDAQFRYDIFMKEIAFANK